MESESESEWDDILLKYQCISDFFSAVAYFTILVQLTYYVRIFGVGEYKRLIVKAVIFLVLSVVTHLLSVWTYTLHSLDETEPMTVGKVMLTVVCCVLAILLVPIAPHLLYGENREVFMKDMLGKLD
ncbi:hypothetical protein ACFE04_009957 [Oxalis oulophora]